MNSKVVAIFLLIFLCGCSKKPNPYKTDLPIMNENDPEQNGQPIVSSNSNNGGEIGNGGDIIKVRAERIRDYLLNQNLVINKYRSIGKYGVKLFKDILKNKMLKLELLMSEVKDDFPKIAVIIEKMTKEGEIYHDIDNSPYDIKLFIPTLDRPSPGPEDLCLNHDNISSSAGTKLGVLKNKICLDAKKLAFDNPDVNELSALVLHEHCHHFQKVDIPHNIAEIECENFEKFILNIQELKLKNSYNYPESLASQWNGFLQKTFFLDNLDQDKKISFRLSVENSLHNLNLQIGVVKSEPIVFSLSNLLYFDDVDGMIPIYEIMCVEIQNSNNSTSKETELTLSQLYSKAGGNFSIVTSGEIELKTDNSDFTIDSSLSMLQADNLIVQEVGNIYGYKIRYFFFQEKLGIHIYLQNRGLFSDDHIALTGDE